jgi:hypothetical protein
VRTGIEEACTLSRAPHARLIFEQRGAAASKHPPKDTAEIQELLVWCLSRLEEEYPFPRPAASHRLSRNWDQLGVSRDRTKSGVPSDRGKGRGGIAGNFLKYASEHYEWYEKIEKVLIAENVKKLRNAQMSSDWKRDRKKRENTNTWI